MFCIKYKTWKEICKMYFLLKSGSKKAYLQWFPLTKLATCEKKNLCSEDFYNRYIKNFSFILFKDNLHQSNNFLQKSDGSFRSSSLISPTLYLVLQAIGKEIYDLYRETRDKDISIYYAGSYKALRPSYKQDYDEFFKEINSNIDEFEYFIKTDITNFYSSISINKLIARIDKICNSTSIQISQSDLLIIKELLLFCGDGNFPLIENSLASSYLSTIIYLDDIDTKLFKILQNKFPEVSSFKIIRYVDDMYILFSSEKTEIELHAVYNEIRNTYSSLLKEYNLSLNARKSCFNKTSKINDELKKSLYDEIFNGKKHNIEDHFPDSLYHFIKDLSDKLSHDSIDVDDYNELINKNFSSDDIEFTPNEVLNYFVYENSNELLKPQIVKELIYAVQKSISFISLDPKRLTLMIMKTKNDVAIKAFLNQLFSRSRAKKWNSYDTTIAITYLIQNQFKHIDLLRIIQKEHPPLFSYYERYCKNSFFRHYSDIKLNQLQQFIGDDVKAYYLYFMFLCEYKKGNIMSAFAYYKNFFDRVTADIDFAVNHSSKRPYYNNFYKEKPLIQFYRNITNSEDIINRAHTLRNSNPLSHSSSELLDNNDSANALNECIESLSQLILSCVSNYL